MVRRHGQRDLLMPPLVGEERFYGRITGSPSSLSAGDLRIGQKHSRRGDAGRGKGFELLESLCHENDAPHLPHSPPGKGGRLVAGDTKTYAGTRKIVLPPSTAELLRTRKKASFSPWVFHDSLRPAAPVNPSAAYHQLKKLLAQAGLPSIRFHDLRHTNVKRKTKNIYSKIVGVPDN